MAIEASVRPGKQAAARSQLVPRRRWRQADSTAAGPTANLRPHATHVVSQSSQGFSTVQVQFDVNSSSKEDLDAVNQRVAQVQLPQGVGRPIVQTFSFSALPSMTYSLAATDGDLRRATDEARN